MEYIASLSYGKDSIAMLEVIAKHSMPLDRIVHVEIMATEGIPADHPDVVKWKQYADDVIRERYGISVEHIHAAKTFEDLFYCIPKRKESNRGRQGQIRGFPSLRSQWCSKELKVDVLRKTNRINVQYIGIAADEPRRHSQLTAHTRSPLVEHGITEAECLAICEDIGLVAPTYLQSRRSGCWFCPFQPTDQLRLLREQQPQLWQMLLQWDADSPIPFRHAGLGKREVTVSDFDRRFQLEGAGLAPMDLRFRWSALEAYANQARIEGV